MRRKFRDNNFRTESHAEPSVRLTVPGRCTHSRHLPADCVSPTHQPIPLRTRGVLQTPAACMTLLFENATLRTSPHTLSESFSVACRSFSRNNLLFRSMQLRLKITKRHPSPRLREVGLPFSQWIVRVFRILFLRHKNERPAVAAPDLDPDALALPCITNSLLLRPILKGL